MAMQGTHIRFAVDVMTKYLKINDPDAYLSGTVYPDSRYITGLDRSITHNAEIIKLDPNKSDFELGMAVHVMCDQLQGHILRPMIANWETDHFEWWLRFTALKFLHDQEILQSHPIQEYLHALNHVQAQNSENIELLKKYNSLIQQIYSQPISINTYLTFSKFLGSDDKTLEQLRDHFDTYSRDEVVRKRLKAGYAEMMTEFDQGWRRDPILVTQFGQ